MRGLTLWQPWASLVAIGWKLNETRSWPTSYRGPIAIHASMRFTRECRALCATSPFRTALATIVDPAYALPRGVVLAVATLVDVKRTADITTLSEHEQAFGNYGPGRYAFLLDDVRELTEPVPMRGMQGLWPVSEDGQARIAHSVVRQWHVRPERRR